MKKYKKFIIPSLILVGGLLFIFKDKLFKKKQDDLDINNDEPTPKPTFPLAKGSKGSKVKELQKAILSCSSYYLPKYGADGDFGSETESALVQITGKKIVDSQAELDSIKAKCSGGSKVTPTPTPSPTTEQQRIKLGQELKAKWEKNKSLSFIATQTTDIGLYFVDRNGKYESKGKETIRPNVLIEKGNNVNKIVVNSKGFMELNLNVSRSTFSVTNMITVSPFAVNYI